MQPSPADTERPTVVVADPIHADGVKRLAERFDVSYLPDIDGEKERQAAIAAAEAIIVRVFTVDRELLAAAPKLRLVAKHGSGVDNIDIPACSSRGVMVANTPGGNNATAVAEGAVALMLAVQRRTRQMDACVREDRFQERWRLTLHQIWGKRLGLVGFGQIARVVSGICGKGFAMEVSAFDPFVSAEAMAAAGARKIESLAELATTTDVLSIHAPLSAETRGMVGRDVLTALPRHAIVVNTSRGGLVDESALIDALHEGRIAGAGLDVFEREPPAPDNPLLRMENVALSPHVAGVTAEALRGMAMAVAEVVENVFADRRPATLLNTETWPSAKP